MLYQNSPVEWAFCMSELAALGIRRRYGMLPAMGRNEYMANMIKKQYPICE
jgi:hypothetical protein